MQRHICTVKTFYDDFMNILSNIVFTNKFMHLCVLLRYFSFSFMRGEKKKITKYFTAYWVLVDVHSYTSIIMITCSFTRNDVGLDTFENMTDNIYVYQMRTFFPVDNFSGRNTRILYYTEALLTTVYRDEACPRIFSLLQLACTWVTCPSLVADDETIRRFWDGRYSYPFHRLSLREL